jgi:hypothetical protein
LLLQFAGEARAWLRITAVVEVCGTTSLCMHVSENPNKLFVVCLFACAKVSVTSCSKFDLPSKVSLKVLYLRHELRETDMLLPRRKKGKTI